VPDDHFALPLMIAISAALTGPRCEMRPDLVLTVSESHVLQMAQPYGLPPVICGYRYLYPAD